MWHGSQWNYSTCITQLQRYDKGDIYGDNVYSQ